jgi:hypothetical protein
MRRDSWRSVPMTASPPVSRTRRWRSSQSARARARRLVALGQKGEFGLEISAEHDVGPAPGHVGGDRDCAGAAGLADDLGLAGVLLGVEHLVRDPAFLEELGEVFGILDRGRPDEHRLTAGVARRDVLDDGLELAGPTEVDEIAEIAADHRTVGGDDDHLEAVDVHELVGLGVGRAGHARELVVEAEIVLERDRGERLVLGLHAHPLLGLDRLMKAVGPAASLHGAAGELVDDDHFAVANDVIDFAAVERVGTERGVEMVKKREVPEIVETLSGRQETRLGEKPLHAPVPLFGEMDLTGLLVDLEIARPALLLLGGESAGDAIDRLINPDVFLDRTGNDEGRAGLVDEHGIDFVDHRVVEPPLHPLLGREGHIVAEVVEPEFVVRSVRDVGPIGALLARKILLAEDHTHLEAKRLVDGTHPLGVAAGQVVVDGHDVHALAVEGVEVGGECRDEGLAFARGHLGDAPFVKHHAPDELDVEMPEAEPPAGGLTDRGKGLGEKRVEIFPRRPSGAERLGRRTKSLVVERPHAVLEGVDLGDAAP